MDCQEELKIMKQMNRDLMDEVELLRKQINDLEQDRKSTRLNSSHT